MKILAVDDEILGLKNLELKLNKCEPDMEFTAFQSPVEALEWLKKEPADVAFLDISMGEMDGITLAKKIREVCPTCAIIFLTGYTEHAVEAFSMKVSGYLLKPINIEGLQRELAFVKEHLPKKKEDVKKLVVQCFGNFSVFANGVPLIFSRSKSKELMAYLVDRRGAYATMAEIASVLWADGKYDRSRNNQIHTYLHDLVVTLREVTQQEIILRKRNGVAINVSQIECDYYNFLKGDTEAINSYAWEYMTQYWWSEFTTGRITEKIFK